MDARLFLAEFGHIANAPGGVARLRELTLQLAISGGLVERAAPETPVLQSLASAAKQRERYEAEFELRVPRPQSLTDEWPYRIPDHWKWVRLEQLALYIQRGKSPQYAQRGSVQVISQKCVQWGGLTLEQARFVANDSVRSYGKERFLAKGDLLWNSTGTGTVGRVALFPPTKTECAVADTHITVLRPTEAVLSRYLWCVIASPWIQARMDPSRPDSLVSGTTQQVELATNTARGLPIPCPPIEEQARIIAKVDELIALCGKLEAQHNERRKLQGSLRRSTLEELAQSASSHELMKSWIRVQTHFEELFSVAEDVEDLRKAAMGLAVRGYLTEQLAEDEPALHLLGRIAREQERRISDREMKRPEPLPAIDPRDAPFELPAGWAWARFPDLGLFARGRSKHRPRNDPKLFAPAIYPFVQTGEVARAKGIISAYHSRYSDLGLAQSRLWPKGTLCITIAANIAEAAILGFDACFPDSVVGFIPTSELVDEVDYFLIFMRTAKERLLAFAPSTAQKNINLEILNSVLIPIPPKAEIQRILVRVKQIEALCDRLADICMQSRETGQLLASAAVSSLIGITVGPKEYEAVKAPETELIAPLRLGQAPDVEAQAPLARLLAQHEGEMTAKDLWQRFSSDIDAFYAQLKVEVSQGWIEQPSLAEMREVAPEAAST
jgi:type I restriction enzyme S subunit